jgi:GMP synthase-like glutamine amidotransferase
LGIEFGANDSIPWVTNLIDFVKQTAESSPIKMVGICFGHQMIAKARGGKVETNAKGWEVGWTCMNKTERGREVFRETEEGESLVT